MKPVPESFFRQDSPCVYRHAENNRTTSAIGMHITNQLRRNNYGGKREPRKCNHHFIRPHVIHFVACNIDAIKQLASRLVITIE